MSAIDESPLTQTELSLVLRRVDEAARRLRRADAAFRLHWRLLRQLSAGPLDSEALQAAHEWDDAIDLALVSANRACQGRKYLRTRGLDLPSITQAELIRSLRDLQEHWEEWLPKRDPLSLEEKPWLKTRSAGKRLEALDPKPHWEGWTTPSSDGGLSEWQGLHIPSLQTELDALHDYVAVLSASAPKHPSILAFERAQDGGLE